MATIIRWARPRRMAPSRLLGLTSEVRGAVILGMGTGKGRQAAVLGVDLSGNAVRILELAPGSLDAPQVVALASATLPDFGALSAEERLAAQGEALRRCCQEAGTRARRAALAVPTASVLTAIVPFEAGLDDDTLALRVTLEAEQHLSVSLQTAALDFERLGLRRDGREDVLLVACRQEDVALRQRIAEAAGLEAALVDVEGYALGRALRLARPSPEPDAAVSALLFFSAVALQLLVYQGNRPLYWRQDPLAVGAEAVPELYLEVAPAQAERALAHLHAAHPTTVLDDIAVAGPGALVPGLLPRLEAHLGRACWVADPFLRMTLGPGIEGAQLAEQAPAYLVACGLAQRGLP